MSITKLPITAIVFSKNEGHVLEDCLKSISFCDELIVVSINSLDNTKEIAERFTKKFIVEMENIPFIELKLKYYIDQISNDWFLLIDPDERLMPNLVEDIRKTIANVPDDISMIRVPMFNFFKGKLLTGTVFGGLKYARLLFRKSGVVISTDVHTSIQLKEGFYRVKIKYQDDNFDKHLWCDGWSQLLDKHKRYISGEGKAQYNLGKRYTLISQIKDSIIKFYFSYKAMGGYKLGFKGIILSFLAARYEFLSWTYLRKYQKTLKN